MNPHCRPDVSGPEGRRNLAGGNAPGAWPKNRRTPEGCRKR